MMSVPPPDPPPFLDQAPPPWAARGLAVLLLLLFAVGIGTLFAVEVPETVSASFVLEPLRGADPIRALHPGIVSAVNAAEAVEVAEGDVLFVLASEQVGDRMSERQTVDARLSGGRSRMENERVKFENQQRADDQEQRRLEQRLAALARQVELKNQQLALTEDIAARRRREYEQGVVSWLDANRPRLEVDQLAGELEQLRIDIVDARNALARLTFEMASQRAAFTETERTIAEDLATLHARKAVLDRDVLRDGNALSIQAPCAGTVVTLHVRQAGAVVDETDLLAEIVCAGEPLQAELMLPERGLAQARVGQAVKLMYDAFPYQRYGVQFGTLRWLSPASTAAAGGATFRAFADLGSQSVGVQGAKRSLLPGMTGRAAVVVGRRSLASYALEPLRQLRESFSVGPPADSGAAQAVRDP
jgi:membrane fusion protein